MVEIKTLRIISLCIVASLHILHIEAAQCYSCVGARFNMRGWETMARGIPTINDTQNCLEVNLGSSTKVTSCSTSCHYEQATGTFTVGIAGKRAEIDFGGVERKCATSNNVPTDCCTDITQAKKDALKKQNENAAKAMFGSQVSITNMVFNTAQDCYCSSKSAYARCDHMCAGQPAATARGMMQLVGLLVLFLVHMSWCGLY